MNSPASLDRYRPWFFAAAAYNLLWGSAMVLFPEAYFDLVGIEAPRYLALWQCIGMFVLVYAPAYWWVSRRPAEHHHLIVIGLLGKILGPVGFAWALLDGSLPRAFGWTLLTNDLLWWPSFGMYLRDVARLRGGWRALVS